MTSLLANSTSSMEVSSTTTRSASKGWSRSKAASPPGRSCSSRVQGGRLQPGQLGQPLGRPTGRGGQDDLGAFGGPGRRWRARCALAAARPAGQHRHPLSQRQLYRRDPPGASVTPMARPSQSSATVQSTACDQGSRSLGARSRRRSPARATQHDGTAPARSPCPCPPASGDTSAGSGSATTPSSATNSSRQRPASAVSTPSSPGLPGRQLGLGQIAVTVLACLRQGELQAGLDPLGAVVRDAQALGD